jgi:hypothetical protein
MLSASFLAISLALTQIWTFLAGTEITRRVGGDGDVAGAEFVTEIVHDPALLLVGAALVAIGGVFIFVAYRVKKGATYPDEI